MKVYEVNWSDYNNRYMKWFSSITEAEKFAEQLNAPTEPDIYPHCFKLTEQGVLDFLNSNVRGGV